MNTEFLASDRDHRRDETTTHPLARRVARLPLSLVAAATFPDAPSSASNHSFPIQYSKLESWRR